MILNKISQKSFIVSFQVNIIWKKKATNFIILIVITYHQLSSPPHIYCTPSVPIKLFSREAKEFQKMEKAGKIKADKIMLHVFTMPSNDAPCSTTSIIKWIDL